MKAKHSLLGCGCLVILAIVLLALVSPYLFVRSKPPEEHERTTREPQTSHSEDVSAGAKTSPPRDEAQRIAKPPPVLKGFTILNKTMSDGVMVLSVVVKKGYLRDDILKLSRHLRNIHAADKPLWIKYFELDEAKNVNMYVGLYEIKGKRENLTWDGVAEIAERKRREAVEAERIRKEAKRKRKQAVIAETKRKEAERRKYALERAVEGIVTDVMGKTANWRGNPKKIIAIHKGELLLGPDKGGLLLTIEYRADKNLTVNMTRGGIVSDIMSFTKRLYNHPACSRVKQYRLVPYLRFIDKYGREREEKVGILLLRRVVADKINWDNMYSDLFEKLLQDEEQFWFHPVLKQ